MIPLGPMPNQQLNLTNSITKETSPIISFLFMFTALTGISDSSLSPFEFNSHFPEELNPSPLAQHLTSFMFGPQFTFQSFFSHYFLESTTLAKLNYSSRYTLCFPTMMPVHFIPSWNALLFTFKGPNLSILFPGITQMP